MKKFKYLLVGFLAVSLFGSCKKFLTVTPKTQLPQDVIFSTDGGFKDALTGVYIQLKSNDIYGQALTQTTIEQLISNWDVTANTTEQRLGLFNFADDGVLSRFRSIWRQEYKVISSINAILGQIDVNKDVFTSNPDLYNMIKSECLALRAYCHFDILRMFGPVPTDLTNAPKLPYALTLSNSPQPQVAFDAFKAYLLKDLEEAEALIKDKDPIQKYTLAQLRNPGISSGFNPLDNFIAYRYLRMNYYAIKALQARAYLWFGDNDKAYQSAKEVIEAKNSDGGNKFRLGTATDMSVTTKDFVLSNEQVFGLYAYNLNDLYTSSYASGTLKKGTAATTVTNTLYGNTGTDIRESNMWELITLANASKAYIIRKYMSDKNPSISSDFKQIPMLRLSEMYLIAAEAAPYAEGAEYFKTFRTSRNIGNMPVPADPALLKAEIIKEYRKEFYAEGQAFFTYKRLNSAKTAIIFAPAAAVLNYIAPIPKEEII